MLECSGARRALAWGAYVSDRDLLRMTDDEVARVLAEGQRVQVATTNPDGTVHLVPLSYFVSDGPVGTVGLWTDPASRKVANLRRNPQVTCLVEMGTEFADFRAVQIVGRASLSSDHAASCAAGEALFERGMGSPLSDDLRAYVANLAHQRVAVTVTPERVVSWDHRKLAGARPDDIGS